jgi:hypothetical protein
MLTKQAMCQPSKRLLSKQPILENQAVTRNRSFSQAAMSDH